MPFSVGPVLECRGQRVVVLASGDPFWHGAGAQLVPHLTDTEWQSHPAPSTFQLAANRLGWAIERVDCLGLHAAPFARAMPRLHPGARLIATLRDGAAAAEFARWLVAKGWTDSRLWVMESLGGPQERIRQTLAQTYGLTDVAAPVIIAFEPAGAKGLPCTSGRPDAGFAHDGQITKSAIRALTLSALAPRPGEVLWDLGAGSGSVSVEWCLAGGRAIAVEVRPDRTENILNNARKFGVDHRLDLVTGRWADELATLPAVPDAVFIGGGADAAGLERVWHVLPGGCRMVINSVTLETDALLARWQADHGGTLLRIDLAHATPLGKSRGWSAQRTVTQWSVSR